MSVGALDSAVRTNMAISRKFAAVGEELSREAGCLKQMVMNLHTLVSGCSAVRMKLVCTRAAPLRCPCLSVRCLLRWFQPRFMQAVWFRPDWCLFVTLIKEVIEMNAAALTGICNFRLVDDGLATAGQPSGEEIAVVALDGWEVVINLTVHGAGQFSLPDEQYLVEALGMKYLHIPVDLLQPSLEDLETFFDAMESNAGKRIFLHCAANKRVSAFLGLFRVIRLNWEWDSAFALMREIWEPTPVWTAFIEKALRPGTFSCRIGP